MTMAVVKEVSPIVTATPANASLIGVAPPDQGGDAVDHDRRDRRAGERQWHVREPATRTCEHDPSHDGGRRTGIDAHDAGVGERVAGHPLEDRAAHAQGRADQHTKDRPRHAHLRDHGL